MKYIPWLILSLPFLALLILWNYLPDRMPIHSSDGEADRYGSRSDFGGVVVGDTALFALMGYIVLQAVSSFTSMNQQPLDKAYWSISVGSALVGFTIILKALT